MSASVFSVMHQSVAGWRYTLANSIRKLVASGCVFVTIAGNDAKSACGYLPANLSLPIVVGGSTPSQTVMRISNYGDCIDIFAPGTLITIYYNQSAKHFILKSYLGKAIKSASISCPTCTDTFTGTSFAVPHVTGIAAILLEKCPRLTHRELKSLLMRVSLKDVLHIASDQSPTDTPNRLAHLPNSLCECRIRD